MKKRTDQKLAKESDLKSRLPVDQLIEACKQLTREVRWVGYQTTLSKEHFEIYSLQDVQYHLNEMKRRAIVSEASLRSLCQQIEYDAQRHGIDPISIKPSGSIKDDIWMAACRLRVELRFVEKFQKIIQKESATMASAPNRRLWKGVYKRAGKNHEISECDGMKVENGIVVELGISAQEYLQKCRDLKAKQRSHSKSSGAMNAV